MQEAWILSLLCPNVDQQAANQLLSSESKGNTEGKIKQTVLSTSTSQHFALVCTISYSVELAQSTLGFTALPFPQLLQNFQKQLAKTVEEKKPKLLLPETH